MHGQIESHFTFTGSFSALNTAPAFLLLPSSPPIRRVSEFWPTVNYRALPSIWSDFCRASHVSFTELIGSINYSAREPVS